MTSLAELSKRFFRTPLGLRSGEKECLQRTLYKFCETGTKEDAFCVYFAFCEAFRVFGSGYGTLGKLVEFLSDHEYHSGELLTKHRDHYSHSAYVFALGLAIYACDGDFRSAYTAFYPEEKSPERSFLYLWGMTALFHDVGYPFQLAHEQVKTYVEELWGEKNPQNPYVGYENVEPLCRLSEAAAAASGYPLHYRTLQELLSYHIHARLGYPMHVLLDLLERRHHRRPAFMDHAFFSALLLSRQLADTGVLPTLPILDVLTAIALHNSLNRYDLAAALGEKTAIPLARHPLAYLLVLCDELQNWDRRAFGHVSKKDPLAYGVRLSIGAGSLKLDYLFDSLRVKSPTLLTRGGVTEIGEEERYNQNVLALRGKRYRNFAEGDLHLVDTVSFTEEIGELLVLHTTLLATARRKAREKKVHSFASSDKLINLADFAEAIHESYREAQAQNGEEIPPFDELSLEFKLSNIEQAKSYAEKLELINCFYSDKEMEYPVVNRFVEQETEADGTARDDLGFLAREEHLRWVKEKLEAGWRYGREYIAVDEAGREREDRRMRNRKKLHKDLLPYDLLPEREKEKDRIMIRNMIPFLYRFGHGVRIYSYRDGRKPVLNVAGCGHRTVRMNDPALCERIKDILRGYMKDYRVVVRTNFAFGADQLIARCAAELGITIKAALPLPYEEYIAKIREDARTYNYPFTPADELDMRHLLALSVTYRVVPDPTFTYLEASKYIISKADKLIALWDGVETKLADKDGHPINQGGTYHNIRLAEKSRGLTMGEDIHIIPCER